MANHLLVMVEVYHGVGGQTLTAMSWFVRFSRTRTILPLPANTLDLPQLAEHESLACGLLSTPARSDDVSEERMTTIMRVGAVLLVGLSLAACRLAGPGHGCSEWQGCAGDYYCAAVGVCTKGCSSDEGCRVSCSQHVDCPGLFEQCEDGFCSDSSAKCVEGYCQRCDYGSCDYDPYAPLE
jgi:hypothetical protein